MNRDIFSVNEESFEIGNYVYGLISEGIWWPGKIYRKKEENNFVYLFGEINKKWVWLKNSEMKIMKHSLLGEITNNSELYKTLIQSMKEVEHNIRKDTYKLDSRNDDHCFICQNIGFLICCDTCPNSSHPECSGFNSSSFVPSGKWYCSECEKYEEIENKFYEFHINNLNDKIEKINDKSFIVLHINDGSIVHYKNNGYICEDHDSDDKEEEEEEKKEKLIIPSLERRRLGNKFLPKIRIPDPLPRILKRSYWKDLKERGIDFADFTKKQSKDEKKKKEKKGIDQYFQDRRKRKFENIKLNQNEFDIHLIENNKITEI